MCAQGGSGWERELYALCDAEQLIVEYALEAYRLKKPAQPVTRNGVIVCPEQQAWDVATANPAGLLIEMQGQGHISRLVTKGNNIDSSLVERQLRDQLYAEAAMEQGMSVLWLWVDESITCRRAQVARWAAQLKVAVQHVAAGAAPQLFMT